MIKNTQSGRLLFNVRPVSECCPATRAVQSCSCNAKGELMWQLLTVDRAARAMLKKQKPMCIWFTGLSGAGKSTLGSLLEKKLHDAGRHTYVIDGDEVRLGLNRDLGFAKSDRVENVRRVAEVARLMVDAGLIVIVALISPFRTEREFARSLFETGEFIEIYLDAPLEVCERRDPKGLYARARKGKIPEFTGIGSPYEPPFAPEIRVCMADDRSPVAIVDEILMRIGDAYKS